MLNQTQQAAACHGSGPCLVIAGPGSGKTTVLTERILYLVQELHIPQEQILVVTFTREAASEMRRRFLWKQKSSETNVTFGTFHSVFFQILKEECNYQTTDILTAGQKHQMMESCRRQLGITSSFEELSEEEMSRIQQLFAKKKKEQHRLDFDDMIGLTHSLLLENQQVLTKWRDRFRYFLVDEMQDMSDGQYEVLKLLAAPLNNLFMVGDDDQAIYGFRGAKPSIMLGFPSDYPQAKQIVLHVNYRCRQEIMDCSNRLIVCNEVRFQKEVTSSSKKAGIVRHKSFVTPSEESLYVTEYIMKYLKEEQGDIGVLFRNRIQSTLLELQLKSHEITYSAKDATNSHKNHWIYKDIRSYLRMGYDTVYREDFLQVLNKPYRGLPRNGMYQTYVDIPGLALSFRYDENLYQKLRVLENQRKRIASLPPFAAVNYIIRGMGYEAYLKELSRKQGVDMGVYEGILQELLEVAKEFRDGMTFVNYLFEEDHNASMQNPNARVHLHTFHGAKGLEFEHVVLLDANEGITPSKHAVSQELVEEERRMFYVALTRAKKELLVCTVEQRANELLYPSRFLKESGIYSSSDASSSH
ncbi:MAG: ATP-dependent helicase [Lachnospiraceae bacterium]|nr:ATP-dependent helicase [Lachnospiraceae bacterium]